MPPPGGRTYTPGNCPYLVRAMQSQLSTTGSLRPTDRPHSSQPPCTLRPFGMKSASAGRRGTRVNEKAGRETRATPVLNDPAASENNASRPRLCVVGPGSRFLSGITYYTFRLATALADGRDVSVLLMRQLLPTRLYPGHARVGKALTQLSLPSSVPTFDGVDWFWLPSLFGALAFLRRHRPACAIFQWWTGSVLHTYLLLAVFCRILGASVIIEFHEVLDSGESDRRWVARYVGMLAPILFRLASAYVAHSLYEQTLVATTYGIDPVRITVIPHAASSVSTLNHPRRLPEGKDRGPCQLLYFGVIRPYKGLEDLLGAFQLIPQTEISDYRLTIAGETWERWDEPARRIAIHPYRNRIRFIDRYLTDAEVEQLFRDADVVVLPYRRCSQSGPLHLAMGSGLPVVTTRVGGLVEALQGYAGGVLVDPAAPASLLNGIRAAQTLRGQHYSAPSDWTATAAAFSSLIRGVTSANASHQAAQRK
jgi:glycosyltransferase involved in cell wall biosynthesis